MKIYFSCSIRGEKPDPETAPVLIAHLKKHGAVLTEHIGDAGYLEKTDLIDEQIFQQDVEWLREADAVVAEVTSPSLGVGYEIGVAEMLGKPILCLYRDREGRRLSAMISGNSKLTLRRYSELAEACEYIDEFFESRWATNPA